ncbi:prepilin-type N-terminal cleavage/methylation domain-containing protein [Cerasicoccus arenae]|nr:prepilin-type N-terminal cleavage/methylation domain-containing protein [Cerasicoccus arenae]MBK1858566.1 prepilin-type N-terminal cleavage/methylation domain-containing protein [Cerasicoccus arenae]
MKTRQTSRPEHAGITLIELMIGMMIIAMIFLSTMATLSIGFRASENARLNGDAQYFLESELEYIRTLKWAEIETLKQAYEANQKTSDSTKFTSISPDPRLSGIVSITARNSRSDQVEVLLSVQWNDSKGKSHDANIVTIVTKSGVTAS